VDTDTCPAWVRWWHRRQREGDIELMWRSLYARADSIDAARVAWDVFLLQEGQGHWRCACGQPIALLFRNITVQIIAE
jgi:hypothetical protein